jgi:enoyl-CoA hydratase/carnithine racemase
MNLEFVKYEKAGRIAKITLNRPEVMNALHEPCHAEMDWIWNDFSADGEIWVAILTGAGDKAFSAGNDLKATAMQGVPKIPPTGFAAITNRFDLGKPVIAAVNGFALGGGFEIALSCDIIIAAEHARFGLPEPKVGLMAAAGGVHRLPRHIPLKIAMGYMLTGRHMTAAEAHRWGVVNEVVPAAELMATAERWANEIAECSPLSVRATKRVTMENLHLSVADAMKGGGVHERELFHSEDAREGPMAFAQKRKPVWKGR